MTQARCRDDAALAELNELIAAAHVAGDPEPLAHLYQQLAHRMEAEGEPEAACFFMTHAYVFGLAAGSPDAASAWEFLKNRGRESGRFIPP